MQIAVVSPKEDSSLELKKRLDALCKRPNDKIYKEVRDNLLAVGAVELSLLFKNLNDNSIMSVIGTVATQGAKKATKYKVGGEIANSFRDTMLPVFYDIGTVIFWCSCVYGLYYIMRKNLKEGSGRIKWAAIGYICLKCLEVFTKMVDNVATNMLNNMN